MCKYVHGHYYTCMCICLCIWMWNVYNNYFVMNIHVNNAIIINVWVCVWNYLCVCMYMCMMLCVYVSSSKIMFTDSNERMYNILVEMIPFMKDIKSAMNYQEFNLTSLNNSILQFNARLDQLTGKLSELQNSLNVSLSFVIEQLNAIIGKFLQISAMY